NGGLESNDRLATLISNRNYQRVSQNYTFDKKKARRMQKSMAYRQTGKFLANEIPLNTLIPLGVIGESSTIESSPNDLLDLTNATEIFAVDYLQELETVSAVMVLKTANKVYEHSKFICDRFLGAELLSVSNIKIREQNFIKSIIKQQDGSKEFALSFSARLNDENKFVIESHWNIDAYEQNAMYYNFQIWSNSIDDLYTLAEEIISLLEVHTPIDTYVSSAPPPVFVKSAQYKNGTVELQVINTNRTAAVTITGGLKRTETSSSEQLELKTSLDGYIDIISLDTGALFDVGFRLSNDNGDTPDDLFVADAPWGLDASSRSTIIEKYEVEQNITPYEGEGYRVARNITLKGTTETYLGVYRAFNPRFLPVDFSQFRNVSFEASGTGMLEVKLLKSGGATYSTNVLLTSDKQTFTLEDITFEGNAGNTTDFSDLKVMLFNLKSKNGGLEAKELYLSNIAFNNVINEPLIVTNARKSVLVPNPMVSSAMLYVYSAVAGNYRFEVYSLAGKQLASHTIEGTMSTGQNAITIDRQNLESGIYMYKLQTSDNTIWSGKIVVR
ncbi:MAG: T9SS type A sorting domain-containing protein, partial [Muriicola sp.]|nr:T9SS type A sorting domain-containing protein [Muriicola sp.]